MNTHRYTDDQLCLIKKEFRSHLNYFGYSIIPGKEDIFSFYDFSDVNERDAAEFNRYLTHNANTKTWLVEKNNDCSKLSMDIHKPGDGIPCKGLKLENMKKVAELQLKATIKGK
jgi:hypothetical protein